MEADGESQYATCVRQVEIGELIPRDWRVRKVLSVRGGRARLLVSLDIPEKKAQIAPVRQAAVGS